MLALLLAVRLLGQATAPHHTGPGWLRWSVAAAGTDCGSAADFAARVAARLGRAPADAAAELGLSIEVDVDRLTAPSPRWHAELRAQGRDGAPAGVRTIERAGNSCEPLAATLALMTALVLQPGAEAPEVTVTGAPPVPPPGLPPRAPAEPDSETTLDGREPPPSRWSVAVAAGPGAEIGLLPGVTPELEALLTVRPGTGAALFASALVSAAHTADLNADQGATLRRAAAGLGGCLPELGGGSRAVDLCVGGELARVRAAGMGFDFSSVQERWSFAFTAAARLRQQIAGPLFVAVGLRLLLPLEHDRVAYLNAAGQEQQIFRTSAVAGSGQLLIGVGFR